MASVTTAATSFAPAGAARPHSAPAHSAPAHSATPSRSGAGDLVDRGTRDRVARLILEGGPLTAARLGAQLSLSAAAIRRHLDHLVGAGVLVELPPRPAAQRGRGRPARVYALTPAGRSGFPHAYDDLATTALQFLGETGGPEAVRAFAQRRAEALAGALVGAVNGSNDATGGQPGTRPTSPAALAEVLTAAGYASSVDTTATGVQVCQHHCPVAQVAAQFPQLCQAETQVFARVLGTHVQRLATIAHGDGVCTTHIPAAGSSSATADHATGMARPSDRFDSMNAMNATPMKEYRP